MENQEPSLQKEHGRIQGLQPVLVAISPCLMPSALALCQSALPRPWYRTSEVLLSCSEFCCFLALVLGHMLILFKPASEVATGKRFPPQTFTTAYYKLASIRNLSTAMQAPKLSGSKYALPRALATSLPAVCLLLCGATCSPDQDVF